MRLIKPERIVAASFSVGCGPSCYLATQRKVAGLVLTAPFASAIEVMLPFPLPFNRYNNAKILSKTDVPLLIFHGADDEVIPLRNAHKLYNSAIGPKELLVIPQASHNNIFEVMGDKYWEKLAEFCKKYASQ